MPTCEICGKDAGRLDSGACAACRQRMAWIRERRAAGEDLAISDSGALEGKTVVIRRATASDRCSVCDEPFANPGQVMGDPSIGGRILFLHPECEESLRRA